jgi:Flp pilus assembly protein TadD
VKLDGEKLPGPSVLPQFLEKRGVVEVLICAVSSLAYLGTISFGFVYDDKPAIVDDVALRSWQFLARYFLPQASTTVAPSGAFYRPITLLWLRLNYLAFGLNPAGWHFVMVACHVLVTYLVFVLVEKLTDNRRIAALAALLFGLHPVHVENVAWLSSVNDLLLSIFLIGSLLAFLNFRDRQKSKLWLGASLLLFALALLSKETAAVFPFLIFGFSVMFARPRTAEDSGRVWPALPALKEGLVSTPYFVLLVIYLAIRKLPPHNPAQSLAPLAWSTMLLTAPSILWFDLKHLLIPISSSEFYSIAYVTAPGFRDFLLPIIFLLAALGVAAYCISRLPDRGLGIFALGLAILTTLPSLYLRAIAPGNFVHDRFLYLPSVGIVIFAALVVERIFFLGTAPGPVPANRSAARIKWGILATLCTAAFALTVHHELPWASNILLYQNAMKYAPQNPILQVDLANELANMGHYDRALPLYLSALQSDPRSWLANYNLGYAYYRTGRFSDAEDYLKRSIQIDDSDSDQYIYLAIAQMQQGKLPQASQNAELAIKKGPLSPGFHFVLAKIQEAQGNRERAIAEYNAEVSAHPENAAAKGELQRLQLPH